MRPLLLKLFAVSPKVGQATTLDAWQDETLLGLLGAPNLGLLSVWSPTFLTVLMEALVVRLPRLLPKLPKARAAAIERALNRAGTLTGEALWPSLALISTWTDGPSAAFIPALRRFFPTTPIQGKGLLATEGVVSVPVGEGPGAALAVTSHFLEFVEQDAPARTRPRLAHELRIDGRYSPLLTTAGGLHRYALGDVVRCVGHTGRTPRVVFEGKLDQVSDLCGEKLHVDAVARAIERARGGLALRWVVLSPHRGRYLAWVDSDELALEPFAERLERELCQSHPYAHARRLGQLKALEARRLPGGLATWQAVVAKAGRRAGDLKPSVLDIGGLLSLALEERDGT